MARVNPPSAHERLKADLRSRINEYTRRRRELRAQYGTKWKGNVEYDRRVTNIYRSLKNYRKRLRRLLTFEDRMQNIDRMICDFLILEEGKLKNSNVHNHKAVYRMAHRLFYRYGIESGLRGDYLAGYTGCKDPYTACRSRLNFIRGFKKNPDWRDAWYNFKEFAKGEYTVQDSLQTKP